MEEMILLKEKVEDITHLYEKNLDIAPALSELKKLYKDMATDTSLHDSTSQADGMCETVINDLDDNTRPLSERMMEKKNTLLCEMDEAMLKANICPECGGDLCNDERFYKDSGVEIVSCHCTVCGQSFE